MAEELDFESEFQAVLHADPFIPLTIVLASGDRHRVDDPSVVSTGVDVITVVYPTIRTSIRFFNIVSVEVHEPPERAP